MPLRDFGQHVENISYPIDVKHDFRDNIIKICSILYNSIKKIMEFILKTICKNVL